MNKVNVLFFATLRNMVGARRLEMELPADMKVSELKDRLIGQYPAMARLRGSMMTAINREYAADEQMIPANAEIALFPPVSGG